VKRLVRAACVGLLLTLGASGCSSEATALPVRDQSGEQLYESQRCALCHGADGSSAFWRPGPELLSHLDSWSIDALAAYLADPVAVAATLSRLDGEGMPAYDHLDQATRRRLAAYVLSLPTRAAAAR